jgi:uncharacterized protein
MFADDNTFRILSVFIDAPSEEFHLRQLARMAGLSPSGALRILRKLEAAGILVKEKTQLSDNYKANLESREYLALKKGYNAYVLKMSGIAEHLSEMLAPEAIVVFGSYARGEDHPGSDIDLAIFGAKEKDIDLSEHERYFRRKISLHFIKDISKNKELLNNVMNGITIYGFAKVL